MIHHCSLRKIIAHIICSHSIILSFVLQRFTTRDIHYDVNSSLHCDTWYTWLGLTLCVSLVSLVDIINFCDFYVRGRVVDAAALSV